MGARSTVGLRVLPVFVAIASVSSSVRASEAMPPGRYEVTIETRLPHLEENMRYSTFREMRCLTHQELSTAFPVLLQPSLKGCRLNREQREGQLVSFLLVCEARSGTGGDAVWQLASGRISGTLRVKLGGKNMTFYQRVTAVFFGECDEHAANR